MHEFEEIIENNIKICYVSPELQNQPEKIIQYKNVIQDKKMFPNMICTKLKYIKEWNS